MVVWMIKLATIKQMKRSRRRENRKWILLDI